MAAQVDLLRAKVEGGRLRDSLDRFIKERKKKRKKRDVSPPADKRERREKKGKLHPHRQHAEHRSHQLQQPEPKPHTFGAGKHVLHGHHHHHHHHHQNHGHASGVKKHLAPALKVAERLQKKPALPAEPPALFTFTPLGVVKAKTQDFRDKQHRDKSLKPNLKKENAEANVKPAALMKNKGESSG